MYAVLGVIWVVGVFAVVGFAFPNDQYEDRPFVYLVGAMWPFAVIPAIVIGGFFYLRHVVRSILT